MSQIILPATAKYNIERERMAERHAHLQDFERQLKELDEHSELVKVSEYAEAPGLIPGFWHVRRTDPLTGWHAYIALRGPEGQFSEPHSGHLNMMRDADLQSAGGFERLMKRIADEENQAAKYRQWTRAEMRQEFMERYLNKSRPSISFANQGSGWRNRARRS